jgi:hypothetical protein
MVKMTDLEFNALADICGSFSFTVEHLSGHDDVITRPARRMACPARIDTTEKRDRISVSAFASLEPSRHERELSTARLRRLVHGRMSFVFPLALVTERRCDTAGV